jgi:deoxyribonuclease V
VDEVALAEACAVARSFAAGLDLYEREPQVPEELLSLDNATLLPLLGTATIETRTAMGLLAGDNLLAGLAGQRPRSLVNPSTSRRASRASRGPRARRRTPLRGWPGHDRTMWPVDVDSLIARQQELADTAPEPWRPSHGQLRIGGCWVCFPRGLTGRGSEGDPAWAAALVMRDDDVLDQRVITGVSGAPYLPGLLALRIGGLLERTTRALLTLPDVMLLDATGRDHPRGAGLALHLGTQLGIPTIGITHRTLLAEGEWPSDRRGAVSPVRIGETVVGCWMRTQSGGRPLVVHPGWRVDLSTAVAVVAGTTVQCRTPEPLRRARQLARCARAAASFRSETTDAPA